MYNSIIVPLWLSTQVIQNIISLKNVVTMKMLCYFITSDISPGPVT